MCENASSSYFNTLYRQKSYVKSQHFPNEYMIEVRYKDVFFLRKGHNGMNRLNEILIVRFSLFLILTKISQKSRVFLYTYSRQRTPSSMSLVKQILTT